MAASRTGGLQRDIPLFAGNEYNELDRAVPVRYQRVSGRLAAQEMANSNSTVGLSRRPRRGIPHSQEVCVCRSVPAGIAGGAYGKYRRIKLHAVPANSFPGRHDARPNRAHVALVLRELSIELLHAALRAHPKIPGLLPLLAKPKSDSRKQSCTC